MMALEEKFDLQLDEEGEAFACCYSEQQTLSKVASTHCAWLPVPSGGMCSLQECRSHSCMPLAVAQVQRRSPQCRRLLT